MEGFPPGFPLPDAPASFGPYLGPGKGGPFGAPTQLGPPEEGFPVGGPGLGDSNTVQHGSGAEASSATDDVETSRSPKRRVGEREEATRPREPSPGPFGVPLVGSGTRTRSAPQYSRSSASPSFEELTSFWNLYQSGMLNQKGGPPVREEYREKSANRILLDEKYFRHISANKYKGDTLTHRTFITDMLIAIGRLDGKLAKNLKYLLTDKRAELAGAGVAEKDWSVV